MTDGMDAPMFEVSPYARMQLDEDPACRSAGRRGRWEQWALDARPRLAMLVPACNRMAGHAGPHRYYDRKARVCAEWT